MVTASDGSLLGAEEDDALRAWEEWWLGASKRKVCSVDAGKGSGFRIQRRFGRRGRTVPAGYSNTLLRFARCSFLLPSHRPPTSRPGPRVRRETPTRSQLSTKYTLICAAPGHISARPDPLQ